MSAVLLGGAVACQEVDPIGSVKLYELQESHDVLTTWNLRALQACGTAAMNGIRCSRVTAMAALAAHDAVNGVKLRYERYASSLDDHGASANAAAAAAMHGVLVGVFPAQQAALDQTLAATLAGESGNKTDRGIALGHAVAAEMLALRSNDGSTASFPFTPTNEPGHYQFTPGVPAALLEPAWGLVTPFAMTSGSQFRSPPPPALTSPEYTAHYNEVKEYGRDTSTTRTADQTAYGHFWYESGTPGWNRISRNVVTDANLGLWEAARLYALANVAICDGFIGGVESKRFYDFWRPITAIRAGDTDGNPDTAPDTTWNSLRLSPNVQEHPSTHSIVGNAVAHALVGGLGHDVGFTANSTTSVPPNTVFRTYTSLLDAADENADSRVAVGIHFRSATDDGLAQGGQIGDWAAANILLEVDDNEM